MQPDSSTDYLVRELFGTEDEEHLAYEQLAAYVDQRMSPDERAAIDAHAATCRSCSADLTSLYKVAADLRESPTAVIPLRHRRRDAAPFLGRWMAFLSRASVLFLRPVTRSYSLAAATVVTVLLAIYLALPARTLLRERPAPSAPSRETTNATNDLAARAAAAKRELDLAARRMAAAEAEYKAAQARLERPTMVQSPGASTPTPAVTQPSANEASADMLEIFRVLERYGQAVETQNMNALREVWPQAPESRAQAFPTANPQSVQINQCSVSGVTATQTDATASCRLTIRALAANGAVQDTHPTVIFTFRRRGATWQIVAVNQQP